MRRHTLTTLNSLLIINWLVGPLLCIYVFLTESLAKAVVFGVLWIVLDWIWNAVSKVVLSSVEAMQAERSTDTWDAEQMLSMPVRSNNSNNSLAGLLALTTIADTAATLALPWLIALALVRR